MMYIHSHLILAISIILFSSILHQKEFHVCAFSTDRTLLRKPEGISSKTHGNNRKSTFILNAASTPTPSIFTDLDTIYTEASKTIKCPFFKRRVADTIDNIAMIVRFLIIRHKSLWSELDIDIDLEKRMEAPGCKAIGRFIQTDENGYSIKHRNLPLETIEQIIIEDWSLSNKKGYYITGKLNSTIYRDDCLFSGPDPDQPVRGLRKYLGAASNLFDSAKSYATLTDVRIVKDDGLFRNSKETVQVCWELKGVLMLPWRPKLKPFSGWTKYHLDDDGLIVHHEEGWNIGVVEVFIATILPELAETIWGNGSTERTETTT